MILNPGSLHFHPADGSALITMSDEPTPSTAVSSLSNNPSAVVSD
jgi:hypothetical protein